MGQAAFVFHLGAGGLQNGNHPELMFSAAARGLALVSLQMLFEHSRDAYQHGSNGAMIEFLVVLRL